MSYLDGEIYYGEWKNNKKNGKGMTKWSEYDSYEGDYVENIENGYGIG